MVTDTSAFNRIQLKLTGSIKNATKEIMGIVLTESKKAYEERKKKTGSSTGALFGSFEQTPITSGGDLIVSGIVFVGGPKAPYAPIVDQTGWKTTTGHKEGYNFMLTGAEKGGEVASEIVIKNLSRK